MGCSNCSGSSGSGGCSSGNCGSGGSCSNRLGGKLDVFNWLAGMEMPGSHQDNEMVEVAFKNTRKEYFKNISGLELYEGEPIVIEAASGYDIGKVSLTGELVKVQMSKKRISQSPKDIRKILRKPSQEDLDKWVEVQELEKNTMIQSRIIAHDLGLVMKISDVEFQADKSKATFFYTAEERVDFRQLIKKLADKFRVRIEMRQIGARQEAGRLGGIGSCGRELCCSTWLTDFRSVSTSAARYQQLSINPLKLAGQCGKLKCCLNFELAAYSEALKSFPSTETRIKTKVGDAFHAKSDIFKKQLWYTVPSANDNKFYCLELDNVLKLIEDNKNGKIPESLKDFEYTEEIKTSVELEYQNVVGQDDLTRFDKSKNAKRNNRKGRNNRNKTNSRTTVSKGGVKSEKRTPQKGQSNKQSGKNKANNKSGNNKPGNGPSKKANAPQQKAGQTQQKKRRPQNKNRKPRTNNKEGNKDNA